MLYFLLNMGEVVHFLDYQTINVYQLNNLYQLWSQMTYTNNGVQNKDREIIKVGQKQ